MSAKLKCTLVLVDRKKTSNLWAIRWLGPLSSDVFQCATLHNINVSPYTSKDEAILPMNHEKLKGASSGKALPKHFPEGEVPHKTPRLGWVGEETLRTSKNWK